MHSKSTRALLVLVAVFAMSALTATSAFAAGKPFVETKPATGMTQSEATLNGVVNPNGAETKYWFEYGTTTAYGSKTAEVSLVAGESNLKELKKIASLSALTTYDFRVVASNVNGTTDGANEVLKTLGPEFTVPTKKKFKGTSGAWRGGEGVDVDTCPTGTITGEISGGQKLVNTVVTFTGCTSRGRGGAGCPLNTKGAKAGEVVTKPLDGELGTVATKEAPSGVGLLLTPADEAAWWEMLENECIRPSAFWYGSLTAEVAVIGKKQTTNKLVIADGSKRIKLDSGVSETSELEAGGLPMEWENTFEVTFEEPVEVT